MPIFESNGVNIPKLAVTPTNLPIAGEVKYYASTNGSMKRIDSTGVVTDAVDTTVTVDGYKSNRTSGTITATIYLDPTTGVDGLDYSLYKDNIANKFQTLPAAIAWINQFEGLQVSLFISGTTVGSKLVVTQRLTVSNRLNLIIDGFSNAGGKFFLNLATNGFLDFRSSNVQLLNYDIEINQLDGIAIRNFSSLQISGGTMTLMPLYGILISGAAARLIISSNNTFNFTTNNQRYVHPSGNNGCTIVFSNHSTANVWNTGVLTGLAWIGEPTNRAGIHTYFCNNTPAPTIPSNIDMSGGVYHYNDSLSLGDPLFSVANFNYPLNVGTSKPVRFTGLNSASADGTFVTKRLIGVNELGEIIPVTGGKDEFLATASQTAFTLTAVPAGLVAAYRAGLLLPNAAFTFSGTAATYVPAGNGGLVLALNDRINFIY
jgi:hypothetical protein